MTAKIFSSMAPLPNCRFKSDPMRLLEPTRFISEQRAPSKEDRLLARPAHSVRTGALKTDARGRKRDLSDDCQTSASAALPPDRLDLEEGETSKLKLNLYYFDQDTRRDSSRGATPNPAGLNIESVTVPSIREAIEIPVSAKSVLANNDAKGHVRTHYRCPRCGERPNLK